MIPKNKKNKCNQILVTVFTAFSMFFVITACKKEQAKTVPSPQPVVPTVLQPKQTVQKPVSSVKLQPVTGNQLDFSAKKDPFKPFVSVKPLSPAELSKQKRDTKVLLPIHSFDVSQFKLIGVVADSKGNKAMVVDPAGKGYVLKLGMTIGKNEGKITRIDTSGVDVVEQFQDDNNKVRKETIRIPLLRKL